MNNSNELKLMEAQISKIFNIIDTAENREISKIAAETLANKCLENPFAIYIIFQNFLEKSKKGKLKVFDDAGFLIDLILEEMDKTTMQKLFENEFFKDFAEKIQEENKFFYTFDAINNEFTPMENVEILPFRILEKLNLENIEPLYSNNAEDLNKSAEAENKESFGKMDLEILFPMKDEIKQEIQNCLVNEKNKENLISNGGANKQIFNSKNPKEKISIEEFINFFSEKINLLDLQENNLNNFEEKIEKNFEGNLLKKKSERKNFKKEENSKKIQKISNEKIQTTEKIEFFFNPLYSTIQNFLKLNSNKFWKTRLCSISALSLFSKFFELFYYKFFKVSCEILKISEIPDKKNEENLEKEFFTIENIKIFEINFDNNEKDFEFFSFFGQFELKIKENLFTNLLSISLIDKVVDFDNEDFICIFKDLNLKLANKILDSINFEKKEISKVENLQKSIFQLLDQAINLNNSNNDWQPIFSILTFLKTKIINNPNNQNENTDLNNVDNDNPGNLILLNKNFFNFSDHKNSSIFTLIEKLMKIDSEEIVNITIQILNKIIETINANESNDSNTKTENQKIIQIFKSFVLLINKYDDIEVGVKHYFNCLHNFIIFFKIQENNPSLMDPICKEIIENHLIFYSLNKNKSVRIKYFNLIGNILQGKLINFSNRKSFIQKNTLLCLQGISLENDKEINLCQFSFIVNLLNSKDEDCFEVFMEFSKFILKIILKINIKDTKSFFIPASEKFNLKEMESFYSTFFLNDLQTDAIRNNYERKMKYFIPLLGNVMKNKIEFVRSLIKNLNLEFNLKEIKLSKKLLFFLKVYYNYLENIEFEENKTLMIPDELLCLLIDNKKLDELPIKIKKKDIDAYIGIGLKFFVNFLGNYIDNNIINVNNKSVGLFASEKNFENFLQEDYAKIIVIYTNLISNKTLKISELDALIKITFNKIKNYENDLNNINSNNKTNKVDYIYENFKMITNNIKKIEDEYHSNKINIRAYSSNCLFLHLIYTYKKIEKISNFVNPILNCLKINTKEAKYFTKNLINMVFNYANSIESRNKILNLLIENSLNSYIEEINQTQKPKENKPNSNSTKNNNNNNLDFQKENIFDFNNPSELKVNYPIKYFFKFFAKFKKNFEMKTIYENFFKENLNLSNNLNLSINNSLKSFEQENSIPEENDEISKANFQMKKNIYFLYNISVIKIPLNFLDFSYFKNFLEEIFLNENLLNLINIEKYLAFIIINLEKIIDKENSEENNFNNSLIIEKIFSYLNLNSNDNVNNFSFKTFEIIFKILNIISDNKNFKLICVNYIFDVIKFINSKNSKLRNLATNLFSKLMKIISYIKLDKNYETQIFKMKKNLKNFDNLNFIRNFVQQKDAKNLDVKNENEENFSLKIKIKENLRSYQIAGIKWLSTLTSLGLGLALCDDMGLGKTIQTLCCIANETKIYIEKFKKNPISLIICPNTLILNWIKESKKFFDEKEFLLKKFEWKSFKNLKKYESSLIKKPVGKNNFEENSTNKIEIFVTSYDRIRDIEDFDMEFFYVVLDEAHIIKNPKTKLYQNIKKINSERRIILTGTPIQNNVMELWSLFDFLMPGFLGSENDFEIKFHKKIYTNIKKLNLEEKLQENIFQNSLNDIRKRIKPFILRRLKQDVLKELPDKIIQDYICEMTDLQKELYDYWENIYAKMGIKNPKEEKGKKKLNSIKKPNNKISVLNVIDSMRKICNFPGMLLQKENSFDKDYSKIIEKNRSKIKEFNSSGKLKALEDILISFNFLSNNNITENNETNNINNGNCGKIMENKILIFSQYRGMIKIIRDFIDNTFKFIKTKTLSSDMNEIQRIDVVNSFNNDPEINILLLTTAIGGLGLSLTSANIVIMYDHDWNPMRDLQAMDRAHRFGQKKTVEVFRLITADSIEEKLISLQVFKKYIANNIVDQSKVHENNLNINSFMESLEEFSTNQINNDSEKNENDGDDKKKSRKSIINSFEENLEKEKINDELEYEYLKRFI